METTIRETFVLPSKGKVYGEPFDPHVTLRSMTTLEEMKRLSHGDSEYRTMATIIEDCLEKPLPISVYDLCLGDYQFLLHKLRVVTYGTEYNMTMQCPVCGEIVSTKVDLDDLEVHEFDEETFGSMELELPVSKKTITLTLQTPRMLDKVKEQAKEARRKTKDEYLNFEVLYGTMAFIAKVDGKRLDEIQLETFVRRLPMKDVYAIIQQGDALNRKVGMDAEVTATCKECGAESVVPFRVQSEFYGPTISL